MINLIYQVLIVILPLITAPYLARVLGAEKIGEYSFAQSIVAIFSLFSVMGTALYGQRTVARCYACGDSIAQPFWEIVILRCISVGIALALYYTLIWRNADNRLLYLIAGIEIISVAFDISWFYQGIEQFKYITVCNCISKLFGVTTIFLFVKSTKDLELYALLYGLSVCLGNLAQWLFLASYLKGHAVHKLHFVYHLVPTSKLFISQFAIQAYTVLDKTMIGVITKSDLENGYYDQAQKLIRALTAIITSIGTVMASRISIMWRAKEQNQENQITELLLFSFRLVFATSLPITIGTILIASRFVPIFYGTGYDPVVRLIQAKSLILPLIACSNIIGIQLFVPTGRENLLTKSVSLGATVNVILNTFFIRHFGALGAVLASIVAEFTVTSVQIFYARHELPLLEILSVFLHYLLMSLFVGLVGFITTLFAGIDFMGLAIIVIVCVITYIFLIIGNHDPILKLR